MHCYTYHSNTLTAGTKIGLSDSEWVNYDMYKLKQKVSTNYDENSTYSSSIKLEYGNVNFNDYI